MTPAWKPKPSGWLLPAGLAPVPLVAPTHAIVSDGLGGVLLSVRRLPDARPAAPSHSVEFLYRVDGEGKLVFKLPLPAYQGPLKDEMVRGENDRGFAARGSLLTAFDVRQGTGKLRRFDRPGLFARLAPLLARPPPAVSRLAPRIVP